MDFSFKVEGLERIEKATREVQANVNKELEKGLYACALKVEHEAKASIASGNKSGRIYKRGNITHKASAPGEAPATDTGRLISSINSYLNKLAGLEAFVVAGRGVAKYATMLEHGTSKMAARPFMFPAVEKSKAFIQERLNKAVRDGALKNRK